MILKAGEQTLSVKSLRGAFWSLGLFPEWAKPEARHLCRKSNVEQELDHITIVDNVLLALGALQTLGLDGGIIEVVGFQIAVANDAGTDEAALEIAVDLAGSLRCLGALADGPCAALLLAVGQEGDQAQQIIAGSDEVCVQTTGFNAHFSQKSLLFSSGE